MVFSIIQEGKFSNQIYSTSVSFSSLWLIFLPHSSLFVCVCDDGGGDKKQQQEVNYRNYTIQTWTRSRSRSQSRFTHGQQVLDEGFDKARFKVPYVEYHKWTQCSLAQTRVIEAPLHSQVWRWGTLGSTQWPSTYHWGMAVLSWKRQHKLPFPWPHHLLESTKGLGAVQDGCLMKTGTLLVWSLTTEVGSCECHLC